MKFGVVAVAAAEGAVLGHAVTAGRRHWRKGHRLAADDVAAMLAAGVAEVAAAVLESGDCVEDAAAEAVASGLRHAGIEKRTPATGRVNLHAVHAGVFTVDKALVDAVNAVDPDVTLATLPHHSTVAAGQMVATVKIIPFAVPAAVVGRVAASCREGLAFAVHPFRPQRIALVQTTLPNLKLSILDKTRRVTEARLARSGSVLVGETRVPHAVEATAAAIGAALKDAHMVLVFGASAVCDAQDVVPAAIRAAGGDVARVGMPVDPGNLLVLGWLHGRPAIGAPGCARSPKENGFDWVLDRLIAGLGVSAEDIAGMGVGGLLTEIPSRPQPRETARAAGELKVHAVLLAAGRSARMGGPNKLLALLDGVPLLRRVAERIAASRARGTVVVTGHDAERIAQVLRGLDVRLAHNPDFASGLAGSLKAGIAALPPDAAGALIVLGDMPDVAAGGLDRMIAAFNAAGGQRVVRATAGGRRGNPVILPRRLFAEIALLEGDTGARQIVEASEAVDVELGAGAELDVDTPEALAGAGGVLQG